MENTVENLNKITRISEESHKLCFNVPFEWEITRHMNLIVYLFNYLQANNMIAE